MNKMKIIFRKNINRMIYRTWDLNHLKHADEENCSKIQNIHINNSFRLYYSQIKSFTHTLVCLKILIRLNNLTSVT